VYTNIAESVSFSLLFSLEQKKRKKNRTQKVRNTLEQPSWEIRFRENLHARASSLTWFVCVPCLQDLFVFGAVVPTCFSVLEERVARERAKERVVL
jgi:hypothetical protein